MNLIWKTYSEYTPEMVFAILDKENIFFSIFGVYLKKEITLVQNKFCLRSLKQLYSKFWVLEN